MNEPTPQCLIEIEVDYFAGSNVIMVFTKAALFIIVANEVGNSAMLGNVVEGVGCVFSRLKPDG